MKMIAVVALALVAVTVAAPAQEEPIPIVRSDVQQQPDGSYQYSFESGNGISQSETGELREALDEENKPRTVVVVRGSYAYPDENGKPVSVTYFADETGFHAEGETIPKAVSRR